MQRRTLVGLGLVAVAAAAALSIYVGMRGDDAAPAATPTDPATARAPQPSARRPTRVPGSAVRDPDADREYVNGVDLSDPSPGVKKWKEPGLPGTFREVVAPDDSENVEEKLTYRTRRLRFQLTDVAATCYDGPESNESIALRYELVIAGGTMTVEGVEVIESNLPDRSVQECIVGAVRSLRAQAPDLPDMRKKQESTIGLDDLAARNKRMD